MKFFSDGEMTWKTMDIKGGIQRKGVEGDKLLDVVIHWMVLLWNVKVTSR